MEVAKARVEVAAAAAEMTVAVVAMAAAEMEVLTVATEVGALVREVEGGEEREAGATAVVLVAGLRAVGPPVAAAMVAVLLAFVRVEAAVSVAGEQVMAVDARVVGAVDVAEEVEARGRVAEVKAMEVVVKGGVTMAGAV